MNGDVVGKLQPGVNFPPTPESPITTPDYHNLNGTATELVFNQDSGKCEENYGCC